MTVLLALAGCTWISAEQLTQGLDRDGDGVDDRQDCDPTDGGTGTLESRFDDLDGDGFGAGEPRTTCGAPPGTAERGGDCDDGSPDVHPNAAEVCNGVDDDCDGLIDDLDPGITGRPELYRDDDGDGVPGDVLEPACVAGHGLLPRAAQVDCDDADPARSPGRDEVCGNGVDDDCDDLVDIAGVDPFSRWFDADGDGVPAAGASDRCIADEPGWLQEPPDGLFDCNDSRADQFPGALEVPGDGIDQDCSGLDLVRCPVDADQDGFAPVLDPLDPNTFTLAEQGTCTSYPAAVDCDDADAALVPTTTYWLDADADGVPGAVQTVSCAPPDSRPWLTVGPAEPDCADDDAGRAPGMPEVPDDGIDQDCSGADTVTCPEDADHDGHGVPGTILEPTGVCALAPCDPGVPGDCDCDDTRADVHPGAVELCDEVDRDCDGAPFAGPLETLWTDGVPGQADVVLTLGRTDVLRVCGDADFDHTLTLSGGR
ncbi:MAG: putative metal-binding motif-containing protein, partial [Myxococcales bacterium]|nr:putative metal-binding motif-containing protein [Myxococcales bacterium]